jgi:hypothetical protein
MGRIITSLWLWLAVYVATLAGIAIFTIHLRDATLADDAQTRQSWQQWRQAEVKREAEPGPIQRAPPKSREPPMVVLLRDNFGVILVASVVFPGIILGFLMIIVRGVVRETLDRKDQPQP